MSHYFTTEDREVNEFMIPVTFRGKTYRFVSDDGVFSKKQLDYGSRVMLEAVIDQLTGSVLDLGCGYGPVGTLVGLLRPVDVTMVDVNPRAVSLAKANALAHGVKAKVLVSDGLEKLTESFDFILLNPPIRAGKAVIYRLFLEAYDHLKAEGQLIIVIQKKHGSESAKKQLQTLFGAVDTLDRSGGYHVLAATKSALLDRDLTDHQEG